MIEVHHLNNSRSQRILWLLEELQIPYNVVPYARDATTMLAPEALKDIHPLGKSPVIRDGDIVLPESGAIVEYLTARYGNGRLAPKPNTPEHARYLYWLHYAEGSFMTPALLVFFTMRGGDGVAPVRERAQSQLTLHLDYIEAELGKAPYFLGDTFSAADVQMSFPLEMAEIMGVLAPYKNMPHFLARVQAMPGYRAALEKGGLYDMGAIAGRPRKA